MPGQDQRRIVAEILDCLSHNRSVPRSSAGAVVRYGEVVGIIEAALRESPYYPGDVRPEDLGDGVVIQKVGDWKYFVHERSEVGVGRFSPLSRSFHLTLSGAVRRFIKHYRLSCKAYGLRLRRWG
jgi:hypothetical protein